MKYGRRFAALAVCASIFGAVAAAGCGGGTIPMAKVKGEVKLDGKPIEKGTIAFLPSDGKGPTAGGDITNGQFSVLVPPGPKRIEIHSSKVVGQRKAFDTPDSPMMDIAEELIPPAYNVQSTLTHKVEMPDTTINLDLKPAAPNVKP